MKDESEPVEPVPRAALDQAQMEDRLARVCRRALPGLQSLGRIRRLSGGASQETWAFDAISDDGVHPLVLRRSAAGFPADIGAAVAMKTEAQIIRAAGESGVPVPHIFAVLESEDGLGEGFISGFIDGETLGGRICRHPALASAREVFVEQCAINLAALHSTDWTGLTGLAIVTPCSEHERMTKAYHAQRTPRPVFAFALEWLRENMIPAAPAPVLVHGDYRNGNMIVGSEGVRSVLDWEAAHIGDPTEDLAWFCAPSWRFGHLDLEAGGVGSIEAFTERYEQASARTLEPARLHFWSVFSILRWGLMCASAGGAFSSGADGSPERGLIARRASESELDLLRLLLPRDGRT